MNVNFLILTLHFSLFGTQPIKSYQQRGLANYEITFEFKNLPDKSNVYLVSLGNDTINHTISTDGIGKFKGFLTNGEIYATLKFDDFITPISTETIVIEEGKMKVEGTIGTQTNYKTDIYVEGSKSTNDLKAFQRFASVYKKGYDMLYNKWNSFVELKEKGGNISTEFKSSTDETILKYQLDSAHKFLKNKIAEWIIDNNDSRVTPYILTQQIKFFELSDIKMLYSKLSETNKISKYGRTLMANIKYAGVYKNFTKYSIVPNVQLSDKNGIKVSLIDIVKKSNLTLIDFWASWCAPCRSEIPRLKKTYNQLQEKGFMIVGISFDKDVQEWKKAILNDEANWEQYIALDESSVRQTFGINGIPAYMLLNKDGKILAFDCETCNLESFGDKIRQGNLTEIIETSLNLQ